MFYFSPPAQAEAAEAAERYIALLNDTNFDELAKLIGENAVSIIPQLLDIVGKAGKQLNICTVYGC